MRKLLIIPCLLMALTSYAQLIIVEGVVLSDQNEPLAGVTITYGDKKTTTSNAEGSFAFEAIGGSDVSFSLAGYRPTKLPAQEVMLVLLKGKKGSSSAAVAAATPAVTYQPAPTQKEKPAPTPTPTYSAPKKTTSSYSNDDWRMFITANTAYSLQQSAMKGISGFGLTLGMFKTGGWYASFMMGPQFPKTQMPFARSATDFLYTGNTKVSRWSGTFGFLAGRVVYFYAGVGYGRRTVFCEAYDDDAIPRYWVPMESKTSIRNGMMCEAGLLANIKGFVLTAGANCLTDFNNTLFWELKFGIGGCFRVN